MRLRLQLAALVSIVAVLGAVNASAATRSPAATSSASSHLAPENRVREFFRERTARIEADALASLASTWGKSSSVREIATDLPFGPFGEVLDSSGAADHRRRFNGKEHDATTGLRYYGFRYYDATLMRWTSGDPLYRFMPDANLSEPQRQNIYQFSGNNPLRFYDPDGRDWKEAAAGFLVGGVDVLTFGTYSEWALPALVDASTRRVVASSGDFDKGRLAGELVTTVVLARIDSEGVECVVGDGSDSIDAEIDAAFDNGQVTSGPMIQFSDEAGALGGSGPKEGTGGIWFHDNINVPGAGPGGRTARVRTHSADPNAPAGSNSASGYTTTVDTKKGDRLMPDGTWKTWDQMTDSERNQSHMPAGN